MNKYIQISFLVLASPIILFGMIVHSVVMAVFIGFNLVNYLLEKLDEY